QLRKKASDPKVLGKLAPFITPGYAQLGGMTVEKLPLSYSKLLSAGALAPTIEGLGKLIDVAISKNDKVRPRWTINRNFWTRHEDQVEMVKEVQGLLIELGSTLVEMQKLQP
ncbi:MAG: hypothetical protein ACYDC1_17645, partial [Limisphaerales bacterium]